MSGVTQGRCAAALLYGRHVALLPAAGSDAMELDDDCDEGGDAANHYNAALLSSRVLDLSQLGIEQASRSGLALPACVWSFQT